MPSKTLLCLAFLEVHFRYEMNRILEKQAGGDHASFTKPCFERGEQNLTTARSDCPS
jgi:hypothetical protein